MTETESAREYEYTLNDKKLVDIYESDTISIYENDLKYKKHNNIDLKRVSINTSDKIDRDTIEYRFDECVKNGYITLDLSHLNLKSLPHIPSQFHNKLQYLFIAENNIQIIEDISYLEELIVFDVCNNKLSMMPLLPEKIEEVQIKNNNINNINSLSQYDYLKRLDCSENNIKEIPIIDSLEILICDKNKIEKIPKLKKLIKLSCSDNMITNIHKLQYLEILECDKNKLTHIEDFINLKELYCSRNDITTIRNLNKIEVIHCYKTNVTKMEYVQTLKELLCDYKEDLVLSKHYTIVNSDVYRNKIILIHFT